MEERKIQLVAEIDTTRTREGFNEIGQQSNTMASTVTRAADQAGRAVDGIGNGAAASSAKTEAAQRTLIASIQRTTMAMEAGGRTTARYYELLGQQRGVDPANLAPFLAQLRQVEAAQLRVNAAVGDTAPNLRNVGVSAAQTAAALRGVPAQFTDIVTSLQGGQAPLTVLIQQGGQLADMFGGAGQAAQALGTYIRGLINPYTVAVAVVAGLAVAYRGGAEEADAYARALASTGNAAGGTVDQLAEMAREIGQVAGSTGAASEAVAAIAGTGQVSVENLQRFATAAVEAQKVIGRSVADTAADFASLKDAPLSALERINDKYHFITGATYAQVKALQDQGRASEAAAVAQDAYAAAVLGQSDKVMASLSNWERGWIRIKNGVSGAVDAVFDFGRAATNSEKIGSLLKTRETIESNLASAQQMRDTKAAAAWQIQLDRNKAEINGLRGKADAERGAAKATADAADVAEARIKWLAEGDKYLSREAKMQREITQARNEGAAAQLPAAEIEKRIADIRRANTDATKDGIESQIEALKRQDAVAEVIARRELARIAAKRAAGSMGEDETISAVAASEMAALNRERSSLEQQLALTSKQQNSLREQAALRGQIAVINERYASRALQLEDDLFAAEQRRSRLADDNYAKVIDSAGATRTSLLAQVLAQKDANEQIGLEAVALGELAAVRLESLAARKDEDAEIAEGLDMSGRLAEQYRGQAAALRELANAKRAGSGKEAGVEAGKDLEKFLDPAKAQSFGEALRGAFETAGNSLSQLTGALQAYGIRQAEIDKARKDAALAYSTDAPRLAAVSLQISRKEAQGRISSYADMTGAAKGFFKEGSKGYGALESAEKAFRAFEIAMAIKTALTKSGLVASFTSLFVASKATETAATVASVGPDIAASMAKGQVAAAVGVATQAQGDPYSAWPRMAAMAAAMAALGFAVSGGSKSDTTAKDRQAAAGTGSVFGDSSAKSESIARSIALAATNSSIELTHTAGMLRALLNIQNSLGGLGNLLIRGSGLTGSMPADELGSAAKIGATLSSGAFAGPLGALADKIFGGKISAFTGKITNAIFGGNVTSIDGGLTANKTTLGNAMSSGLVASQYTDTKKDGGWFRSDKYSTQLTSLGTEANGQLTKVITNMADAIRESGKLLGVGGDAFTQRLHGFVVDIGKISTKGLSGEEIQKQLETVFSKLGDDMAKYAVGGLAEFQKVGEGYLETLVRVATNYANLDSVLQSIGMTFGATGLSSIAAREHMLALAGGIDELAGKTASFADSYLTEAERLAPVAKYVADEMAALGLASIDTRDEFKRQVLGLNLTTEAGREQYVALMGLADAFAKTHAATVDLTKSQQEIADERADLQNQLDELTMSSIQLLNKQRMALDASNRGLFDQIQAAKAAKDAQDAARTSLGDFISKMGNFATSAKTLRDSLMVGSLSTLTPEEQYAQLRSQYQSTLAAAKSGDAKAQGDFSSIATAFLTASQKINGGDSQYAADFLSVTRTSDEIAQWAAGQVDVAQASLNALNDQVSGIASLNLTMLQVAESIDRLPADLVATVAQAVAPVNYSGMGAAGNAELLAEVKALRVSNESLATEVKGLRTEQRTQTGDTITGLAAAIAGGAKTVVAGLDDASTNARSSNYKVALDAY